MCTNIGLGSLSCINLKNRITKGEEKGNLFYLRIQLNQENRVGKFYLLIIYNFDS